MTTTVLETCRILPPPCAAAELTVPLSCFDIFWLHYHPIRHLIFYNHPCSDAEFSEKIVPNLKQSLSLTLKHYLPVAGNLLFPLNTVNSKPFLRYVSGDSVNLTIAVSGREFHDLVGNHARDSDQFYDFIPAMPPLTEEENYQIAPLIAIQLTHFPGDGICVGLSYHHCLGDARSVAGFMRAWGEIARCGGEELFLLSNGASSPPLLDRSVLGDISRATESIWKVKRKTPLTPSSFPLPTNRVRASFTLHDSHIKKLKNLVFSVSNVSSFVVAAAYTWSCLVKSAAGADENLIEVFYFHADGRGRRNAQVDPPVPEDYFGNCLGGGAVKLERRAVGFVAAAEAIAECINNVVKNEENFLIDLENWLLEIGELAKMSILVVSGSPKFDLLDSDFGWGKARRLEVLSMDEEKYTMSLCKSSDSDLSGGGGLVVGLSLPRNRMEAFAAIFENGLKL